MDIIQQNKYLGWVIAILVVLNIGTLTILWIQAQKQNSAPPREGENPQDGSVALMQREIGLSAGQVKAFQEMRAAYFEKTKTINNERDTLKLRIADEIFNPHPDEKDVEATAAKIGELESRMDILRFQNFHDFVLSCNASQREELRPILREVFVRKGPKENPDVNSSPGPNDNRKPAGEGFGGQNPPPPDGYPPPPTMKEKLDRYAKRLSLTPGQVKKVEEILKNFNIQEESFRLGSHPTKVEFENEKDRIRKNEDARIMQILGSKQKMEFETMIKDRDGKNRD